MTIPAPLWSGAANGVDPAIFNHGDGVLMCGGYSGYEKKCQYWQPGNLAWVDYNADMNTWHDNPGFASLGRYEAIVVGSKRPDLASQKSVEILEGGRWVSKASYPIDIRGCTLIAKTTTTIYSFGGYINSLSDESRMTYRYNRVSDEWTQLTSLAHDGYYVNCGRLRNYNGRDVVLCFGAKGNPPHTQMELFDLTLETWEDLGRTAPSPPYIGSLVFILGNKIYRLGGMDKQPSWTKMNKLDFFDGDTGEWEQPTVDLAPGPGALHRHVMVLLRMKVVYKK